MASIPPKTTAERVYLLDTHGMVFQMFHGIPAMNAPDGRPTNAVFGVSRAIMNLYDHGADYLLAVFDHKDPTFREAIDPQYKANRTPAPEELIAQEPLIHQVLEALRVPILVQPGYEADDVMATVAANADERGYEVHLCTSDKDCRQLIRDRVTILNLRKDETMDREGLIRDWGISPEQVVDYQALVGDAVDNVPGVPGVGPKTASKWLQQYGTLENLIAHADDVGGAKVKESLKASIANGNLEKSRTLVKLRTDVPMAFDWDGWRRRDWDGPRLLELYQEFGFRGFANKVRSTLTKSGAIKNNSLLDAIGETPPVAAPFKPKSSKWKGGPSLFDQIEFGEEALPEPEAKPDNWHGDYRLVDSPALLADFLKALQSQTRFAIDLETTGLDPLLCDIVGFAISWKAGEAFYLPIRGPKGDAILEAASTIAALKPILEDVRIGKINQNIKYDQLVLRSHGIDIHGVVGDTMIAHYLLHAGERTHNLDELSRTFLNHEPIPILDLIGKGKKQISMADVPTARVCAYAGEDADVAIRLAEILEPQLESANLRTLYDTLEIPLVDVLAEMEFRGVRLDSELLGKLSIEMAGQLAIVEAEIYLLAKRPFNIASPKQLREVLYDEMKLPIKKRTDTTGDASTDQESLERLAALGYELPKKMIEHRQISKLKGTYVDALPLLVNPKTGRVHTSFNQTVASTGRLSSSDPNLQNIPMRTDQGKQIRQAFIPPDCWSILAADYSQIELRLLAHFCRDEPLCAAFAADHDIHTIVAAEIFRVAEANVSGAQRRMAKVVNFGVIYGISATGLSVRLGMPKREAAQFIEMYFTRYPKVLEYQNRLLSDARKNGFVKTILGRKRTFDPSAIRPHSTYHQRNQAEREAINMEIQGSAADLMKLAMLAVHRKMKADGYQSNMLLSVHDELVFEVPPDEQSRLATMVRAEMVGAMTLNVPLKVDVAAGPNWLDVGDLP